MKSGVIFFARLLLSDFSNAARAFVLAPTIGALGQSDRHEVILPRDFLRRVLRYANDK